MSACSQPGCPRAATHRVRAADGQGPEILMCELHEERAQAIARELGFELASVEITVDLGHSPIETSSRNPE